MPLPHLACRHPTHSLTKPSSLPHLTHLLLHHTSPPSTKNHAPPPTRYRPSSLHPAVQSPLPHLTHHVHKTGSCTHPAVHTPVHLWITCGKHGKWRASCGDCVAGVGPSKTPAKPHKTSRPHQTSRNLTKSHTTCSESPQKPYQTRASSTLTKPHKTCTNLTKQLRKTLTNTHETSYLKPNNALNITHKTLTNTHNHSQNPTKHAQSPQNTQKHLLKTFRNSHETLIVQSQKPTEKPLIPKHPFTHSLTPRTCPPAQHPCLPAHPTLSIVVTAVKIQCRYEKCASVGVAPVGIRSSTTR